MGVGFLCFAFNYFSRFPWKFINYQGGKSLVICPKLQHSALYSSYNYYLVVSMWISPDRKIWILLLNVSESVVITQPHNVHLTYKDRYSYKKHIYAIQAHLCVNCIPGSLWKLFVNLWAVTAYHHWRSATQLQETILCDHWWHDQLAGQGCGICINHFFVIFCCKW